RHVLFDIAPHLVHPLSFTLPVYRGGRVGMFKLGMGMWLYDALALFHAPKFHEKLDTSETLIRTPHLQSDGLMGAYQYSDAYMDDDRLVIETLRSAHRIGVVAANYVKAGRGQLDTNGKLRSLEVTDVLTQQTKMIRARHFISTVGPWTDLFAKSLFTWKNLLRTTKGIHFTLRREILPINDAVVMATSSDKRIIFAIPRGEIVIVGTTDTDFRDDPANVKTESSDIKYLLEIVNRYFPGARIGMQNIISSYAGVRPLVDDGSHSESGTSREHVIHSTNQNVTFVAGGKYTTYRRMARDVIEAVLNNEFELEDRIKFSRNDTRVAINPQATPERLSAALSQATQWAAEFGMREEDCQLLAQRHGMEALEILEEAEAVGLHELWQIEARHALEQTMCLHLRDFMLRRSPLYLSRPDHGASELSLISKVFANYMGWDSHLETQERELYQNHLNTELSWKAQF
ncbi:MAG: FAD-dependent oxidoreductase, partial [Oligoflexia bacterium]|nr:FAD-dependent oxidoreductase [Oligoflexia bacterium]